MIFKAVLPKKTLDLQNNLQKYIPWSDKLGKCYISYHPVGEIQFTFTMVKNLL